MTKTRLRSFGEKKIDQLTQHLKNVQSWFCYHLMFTVKSIALTLRAA